MEDNPYGCTNYGETDSYNTCAPVPSNNQQTSTTQPSSNAGGSLFQTGQSIVASSIIGIVLIVIALMIIKYKRKRPIKESK